MLGEAGNDRMVGGPGFREGGRFSTRTQDGDDTMDGGDGNDRMNGGLGSDSMTGGAGNDRIKGGPKFMEGATDQDGNDNINGGDGNDRINGGFGTDTLNGGAGEDTIHGGGHPDGNSSKDTITRDFMDNGLKGVATFDEPGAPRHSTLCPGADNIPGNTDDPDVSTAPCHVTGTIDYAGMGFSNPPTYGPNHADRTASGSDLGSPVQPTGIHIDVALDDADLVHNLEVGHIWISYDPAHVTQGEINKLRDIVRSIANDPNGAGAGIILTERAANDDAKPIAVASWGHLLKLDHVDGEAIRSFYNHNKGTAPVAFTKP
jgi:hypothetical protein